MYTKLEWLIHLAQCVHTRLSDVNIDFRQCGGRSGLPTQQSREVTKLIFTPGSLVGKLAKDEVAGHQTRMADSKTDIRL